MYYDAPMTNPLDRYPVETLGSYDDDGTMRENVAALADAVVGHRIVSAEKRVVEKQHRYWGSSEATVITLDNGKQVLLRDTSDCCAFTELEEFLLAPDAVDHIIMGVGTTDEYSKWHIFADFGDIMALQVGWSCGNPFYYGYGFDIEIVDVESV